jgi:hypothetical protein
VDRQVAGRPHLAHEVDGHLAAQPWGRRGREQYVDRLAGRGERVARVVDARVAQGEQVAGVRDPGDLGVDDRVQLAHTSHRHAHVEARPGLDHGHPLGEVGRALPQLRCDRLDRVDRRVGGRQVVGVEVVRVLVGDEHRRGAVNGLGIGEDPGVDDHHRPVVLQSHTGVAELRDPHASHHMPG